MDSPIRGDSMTTITRFTKEQLIEDLKTSTQNACGMFEIGEETICALMSMLTAQPAPVSVPDDVSGPLAHAYKELTPTFMRNHIDAFERYGIYPDGSAGIQAMRIALDGMTRRAAMLQGQPVSNRDELPVIGWLRSDYNNDDKRDPNAPLFMLGSNDPSEVWGVKYLPLSGNSPVIPDRWIPVSERMPERDVDVQVYCADKKEQMVGYVERNEAEGWFRFASLPNGCGVYCKPTHWMPLSAAPQQEVKGE